MTAPRQQDTRLERRADRFAKIDPGLGTPRPLAHATDRVDADDDDRLAPAFAQSPGDDTYDAGVPVVLGNHDYRVVGGPQPLGFGQLSRLLQNRRLNVAASPVQLVQFLGQRLGFVLVVGRQQTHAQVGAADAAAGIDPRPDDKARMEGTHHRGRVAIPGDLHQSANARILALGHDLQALCRQGSIESGQGRDIADGAQGRQIQPLHQVRARPIGKQPALFGFAIERRHHNEDDAGGGQVPLGGGATRPIGVDDGPALRRILAHQVVIDDHDLQPDRRGIVQRLVRHGATIDSDH